MSAQLSSSSAPCSIVSARGNGWQQASTGPATAIIASKTTKERINRMPKDNPRK
jgi:hypothetical protein